MTLECAVVLIIGSPLAMSFCVCICNRNNNNNNDDNNFLDFDA